jgi:hypothetical protein
MACAAVDIPVATAAPPLVPPPQAEIVIQTATSAEPSRACRNEIDLIAICEFIRPIIECRLRCGCRGNLRFRQCCICGSNGGCLASRSANPMAAISPYARVETIRISVSRIGSQAGVVQFAGEWLSPDMDIVFRQSDRRSRSRISLRAASTAHLTAAPNSKMGPATPRTHFCDLFRCHNYAQTSLVLKPRRQMGQRHQRSPICA